ncbi:hypothetical protein ABH935_008882 [Catenulispora sp. GAS73]|uniref:hypothetical protein n=1 Tax=Catenulispora sp. GAS73 TaxID=3156269 RepID=UPI00351128D1
MRTGMQGSAFGHDFQAVDDAGGSHVAGGPGEPVLFLDERGGPKTALPHHCRKHTGFRRLVFQGSHTPRQQHICAERDRVGGGP